ncbi:LOW QUALITY PROTEIN: hypothetical protein PNEG_04283 [Pneumocystis murina B123]|uniref:Uncharacterized protein n=1 Tax=Pneumocystis murina (strain B123) TaxID=1069680 RepID=A0A0W4ZX14_PNEMU|nr:LOW QUALITY PROTEIN: hypothetical protein PNEG_04283 [Pneumocystis murina B123]KTW32914.1 LOW QUALITY PROTEIN: hypothetical protein PNEG_04283 [Pneumocystis murina B123]
MFKKKSVFKYGIFMDSKNILNCKFKVFNPMFKYVLKKLVPKMISNDIFLVKAFSYPFNKTCAFLLFCISILKIILLYKLTIVDIF